MAIQSSINTAAKELEEAFIRQKAAKASLKELKKALKKKLEEDQAYLDLIEREKKLKKMNKEIREDLQEIKKAKEQIALETEEQKEIDDFLEQQENSFSETKDRVIMKLSRDLIDEGVTAEVYYKSGQLILVVARA